MFSIFCAENFDNYEANLAQGTTFQGCAHTRINLDFKTLWHKLGPKNFAQNSGFHQITAQTLNLVIDQYSGFHQILATNCV
jgi:hypothetical protein